MTDRIHEDEIRYHILNLLAQGGLREVGLIIQEIGKALPFEGKDVERSSERQNEVMYEQKVRNALAPSRPRSLTGMGLVEGFKGMYRITPAGREYFGQASAGPFGNFEMFRERKSRG